jgi:hypothetical protein
MARNRSAGRVAAEIGGGDGEFAIASAGPGGTLLIVDFRSTLSVRTFNGISDERGGHRVRRRSWKRVAGPIREALRPHHAWGLRKT